MSTENPGIHKSDEGIAAYIGDGVYAIGDRYNIILRLDDHNNTESQIVLDRYVIDSLKRFMIKWEIAYGIDTETLRED